MATKAPAHHALAMEIESAGHWFGANRVLHDVNLAARFCDHLLLLYGDSDADHGPLKDLLNQKRLERLYQQPIRLIKTKDGPVAIPRLDT